MSENSAYVPELSIVIDVGPNNPADIPNPSVLMFVPDPANVVIAIVEKVKRRILLLPPSAMSAYVPSGAIATHVRPPLILAFVPISSKKTGADPAIVVTCNVIKEIFRTVEKVE